MREHELMELPIPKMLGRPLYPGGAALPKESVTWDDKNVQEIYFKRVDDISNKIKPNKDEEKFLKYYVLYYIHAPIFRCDKAMQEYMDELLNQDLMKLSLDDLIMKCMEYGIDPL
jgi:hypothetical protein